MELLNDSSKAFLDLSNLLLSFIPDFFKGQIELSVSILRFSQGSIVAWLVF